MTVNGPHRLVAVGRQGAQVAHELSIQGGHGIPHSVGNIDCFGAGLDDRLTNLGKERQFRAVAIFSGKLDIVGVLQGQLHCFHGLLQNLVGRHSQLHLHVQGRRGNEGVNAAALGGCQRVTCPRNVFVVCTGQRTHGGVFDDRGNGFDGFEIAIAGGGETGLYHINLQFFQLLGDADFFFASHGCARALFAVAQGGIEYDEAV